MSIRLMIIALSFGLALAPGVLFADAAPYPVATDWELLNEDSGTVIFVTRFHIEDQASAESLFDTWDPEFFLAEGVDILEVYTVTSLQSCNGIKHLSGGQTEVYAMVCQHGVFITLIASVDKDVVTEVSQSVVQQNYPSPPDGYSIVSFSEEWDE